MARVGWFMLGLVTRTALLVTYPLAMLGWYEPFLTVWLFVQMCDDRSAGDK